MKHENQPTVVTKPTTHRLWKRQKELNQIYKGKKEMRTKKKSNLKSILKGLAIFGVTMVVIAGGVYLWARSSTGTSLIARGIMWGDSDAGDLYRFPARRMQPSLDPVMFTSSFGNWSEMIATLPLDNPDIGAVSMPLEEYLARTNTTAFIILHGNQILYEGYFNGSDREAIQPAFSITKSFFAAVIGIAIEEGYIGSVNDPITEYLPELQNQDPRFEAVTIRNLLSMTSGIQWDRSESNPLSDDFVTYYSPDLRTTALEAEIETEPGTVFLYNDYNPLLLGIALERATGMSIAEYMETRLWQPMGAEGEGSWSLDSETSGFEKTFAGLNGRALDLVKLGWLYLNHGQNGSVEVVPLSWVAQVADRVMPSNQYPESQDYWWVDSERNMYFAEGDKCQFIYVYPQAQLVLARFGTDCGGTGFTDFMANIALWVETQLAE